MYMRGKRVPAPRRKAPAMRHKPFLPPVGGWVSAANLAAAPANTAQVLQNFLPVSTGLKMRGGTQQHARAATGEPLESAMAYVGGVTRKVFGAADGDILDLTTPVDPDVAPAPAVTGQTSDYYASLNFTNPAGTNYLLVANGTDDVQTYDGAAWAALVSGAGAGELNGLASDTVDHLGAYRNRIWMTDRSMTAYYLPVDSIAGTVGTVELAGVFRRGGYIMFTATWSMDAGDGLDDKIVFVSSEGEIAVYQGDPIDTTWGLVGRYDAAPPLGKNAHLRVGGDLLLLTEIGIVPLSAIQSKDPAALALAAISRNIQPDWVLDARTRRSLPWEIVKWTSHNLALVSCPVTSDASVTPPFCYAVNLETGAWSKITNWNTRCFVLHADAVYFGTNDGRLVQTEIGGSDDGAIIEYTYVGQNDHMAGVGRTATARQARAVFRTKSPITPQLSMSTDYVVSLPPPPAAPSASAVPSEWDVGLWDQALWDDGAQLYTVVTYWVSIGMTGFAHAPQLQMTSGSTLLPTAELVLFEVTYEPAGIVV